MRKREILLLLKQDVVGETALLEHQKDEHTKINQSLYT